MLGSATDGGGGDKAGNKFASDMGAKRGAAVASGTSVAQGGKDGLGSVSSLSPGEAFASGLLRYI
ncbi:hypothetical protein BMT17_32395 [Bacillus thuringiensis serovar kurstaki]|nr:hypothetical protein BMT17_32395 [Bacillus thuringiensis serovar kurstaki]